MSATTDFDLWLSYLEIDGDDLYYLYEIVKNCERNDMFSCWEDPKVPGQYFVTLSYGDGILRLANEKSRSAFLKRIEHDYAGDDYDMESQYGFNQAMANSD